MVHIPVMLQEVIRELDLKPDGTYLDLTVGYGGHASEILRRVPRGFLVGIDRDLEAIKSTQKRLEVEGRNFRLLWGDFGSIESLLDGTEHRRFDGILADLGASSPQFDDPSRGFQYKGGELLDMRFNQLEGSTAADLIERASEDELREILSKVLQPRIASRVARLIYEGRPIKGVSHLANLIREGLPAYIVRQKNPLKPIFLALRIAVNGEIEQLERLAKAIPSLLKREANVVFITFNSLEDRLVKGIFSRLRADADNYRGLSQSPYRYSTKTS